MNWRVGENYDINVYEGPRKTTPDGKPSRSVATFNRPEDAQRCVDAVNRIAALEAENAALRQHAEAMAVVSEEPDIDSWERLASATNAYRAAFPKEPANG